MFGTLKQMLGLRRKSRDKYCTGGVSKERSREQGRES
jgi:hypothetical protein